MVKYFQISLTETKIASVFCFLYTGDTTIEPVSAHHKTVVLCDHSTSSDTQYIKLEHKNIESC